MKCDTLYHNARVITVEETRPSAGWIAVLDGKIAALGDGSPTGVDAARAVDLEGATVLPGLYDAHCHVMPTGFFLDSVNLLEAKSITETLALLKRRCAAAKHGEWVFGAGFMSQNMKEGRYPNKQELDSVSTAHPIMVAAQTLHGGSLNSAALKLVEVPDVAGAGRGLDGALDGVLLSDDSFFPAMSQIMGMMPESRLEGFIENCAGYSAKKGVTSVIALLGQFVDGDKDVEIVERGKENFPVDFTTFYQTWNLDDIRKYGLPRIGGCLTLDGAGFEYTMALNEPYPQHPERRGFLMHTDAEVYSLFSEAHANGIQTAFHALGDRAIDQLLYVAKQVIGEQGKKDLRHRVEHFSLPTDTHIGIAAELGLVCSMQPAFSGLWGKPGSGYYDLLLGRERAARMEVFPEILRRGGIICGGSDSPVTLVDPLFGIACCVNNPDPRRNVPMLDAIKFFTLNAAWSVHQEDVKGSIIAGKDADFTVIDKNPYQCAGSPEIYEMKALMTVRGGEITYSA